MSAAALDGLAFDNSYARLPGRFYALQPPAPVRAPRLIALNTDLAAALGLDPDRLDPAALAETLAGNRVPTGATPLAMAYAGHQFGGWVPQLGDGRAVLLGEVIDRTGQRRDIQLKGAGRTPFSRGGDGRAWLGPVLREYLVSEAMHALGVPTTRALAAVTTGEEVLREALLPGAVLTRTASSHIRVGTFQFFAARGDTQALQLLCAHVIARHAPAAAGAEIPALALLETVIASQARLIAAWMAVGFVHGVMNTDNMSIAGETIDFGPCAFLDGYHPDRVFSSIDQYGRYAYSNQPRVAQWNLAQLASSLLPLIDPDPDRAVALATAAIEDWPTLFDTAWAERFTAKIGLPGGRAEDQALVTDLLARMAEVEADFTLTFHALAGLVAAGTFPERAAPRPHRLDDWLTGWRARLASRAAPADAAAQMAATNPAVIPRNHRVEEGIAAALEGDFAPFHALHAALATPQQETGDFADPPAPGAAITRTFCGT